MKLKYVIVLLSVSVSLMAQKKGEEKGKNVQSQSVNDSTQTGKDRDYLKIVNGAKTVKGMFTVYKTRSGSYYFEIPDSLLQRDMLIGSRVISISNNSKISAGQRRSNPILIYFSKKDKYLMMYQPTGNQSAPSSDPIAVSLARNNVVPVVITFDIVARNGANDASVIDVTKLFSTEFDLVFPAGVGGSGKIDTKISQILEIKSFPKNVEVKSFYNYSGGKEPFSISIDYSFLLLPKEPYRVRLGDERINYSSENNRVFESEKPSYTQKYIDRWRIEPRPEDLERYKNGEKVIPQKQIVVYVDTIMPEKWRKYVKKGIETWNVAFEQIGFKNVIKAVDYPRDKNFDPEDSRYNCFHYITSTDANASGPQWIDPRSGEIIQADILWWHDVIDLLQTWRFVQTAAADPDARKKVLDDAVMGDAICYAIAHEMGHVLGLQHNMRGSYAYSTDSLRSPSFTQKYGNTASIMDYARNNYVAQPGDKEKGVRLIPPTLGPYDYFSIKWGYQPIYDAKEPQDEHAQLNKWFVEKGNDPIYFFGKTTASPIVPDPAAQSDALGNDLIKSANYGISNLKYITKNLISWTMEKGDDYQLLQKRYDGITKLYNRLVTLTLSYLGGVYDYAGVYGQNDGNNIPVDKMKQKETVHFVVNELVSSPQWLNPYDITKYLGPKTEEIMKKQADIISDLLGNFILMRLLDNEPLYKMNPYTVEEYLKDLDNEIWTATGKGSLTSYTKNIQIAYVDKLVSLVKPLMDTSDKSKEKSLGETLLPSFASAQLSKTKARITALSGANPQNAGHYKLLLKMIEK